MRVIAKLDVKPPYVVKPVHFEGLRKIGLPKVCASRLHAEGVDEVYYVDIVASLYDRAILYEEIESIAKGLRIPLGVGGGVRNMNDFEALFRSGADKVLINTHSVQKKPGLIREASNVFGSQSVVVNIEAKSRSFRHQSGWECYTDGGRIPSGRDVVQWAQEVESLGAGEILLQSVDRDGRRRGFDIELVKNVSNCVSIPLAAGSGAGSVKHVIDLVNSTDVDGVALSSVFHYGLASVEDVKIALENEGGVVT